MKNNYPTYWLFVIILLLILAGNVFGQDPNDADLNRDGRINLIDFALFINAYQAGNGPLPPINPSEMSLLRMENGLLMQQIAILNAEIEQQKFDMNNFKNFIDQLLRASRAKTIAEVRETMIAIGTQLLNSGVAYTINVDGRNANFKVTFDPNEVK